MDGLVLGFYLLAALIGGFVSGFSGFAMGLVVSGVWLHIITPIETATLIAGYGLMTQGYGIWQLRRTLRWKNVWPLTIGSAIGIPIGVMLLTYIKPLHLRFAVGCCSSCTRSTGWLALRSNRSRSEFRPMWPLGCAMASSAGSPGWVA
jgi:uncharacterized membrane protein YfcA